MSEQKSPIIFTDEFLNGLQELPKQSPRLRANFDLRNSPEDNSQRILNIMDKGTVVPIHCHPDTSESVVILRGAIDWIFYDENHKEIARYKLSRENGPYGLQIPAGQLHGIEVQESGSIVFEAKDGKYIPNR